MEKKEKNVRKKGKYTKIDTTWLEDNHLQILFLLLQVHLMYMYEKAITEITKNGRKKTFSGTLSKPFFNGWEKAQLFQGVKKFSVGNQTCKVVTSAQIGMPVHILILTLFILQYLSVIEVIPIYICRVTTPKHIVDKALYIKAVHAPMEKLWTTQSKTKDLYEHINPTMAKAGTMPF